MATVEIAQPWTVHRGRVAALSRSRTANDPELLAARTALKAERLAEHIRSTVNAAPALSPEQRGRLALLLSGGADVRA